MSEDASGPETTTESRVGTVLAGRYRIDGELGRGGMAVAYAARDLVHDRPLALKCLIAPEPRKAADIRQLFEREFHTLQQLSHPRVVTVYDFGRDEGTSYYTMEWLGGGDLGGLAPLPAQRVCALLSDVASALSLLHSRRMVHRDVTPRNVRCTEDGLAKLIDFGAVVPFGVAPRVVGTPAYCAPEAVHRQELDGRTDLFSLGATAYYALTGRNAFPARSFGALSAAWANPPRPPSHYAPDIPPALDELVLSLLALDRSARPSSAAEVMERLCVIGGIDTSEQFVVQQAYLTTPRLVGRGDELARVRVLLSRALQKRMGIAAIVGAPGSGKSRFLASCTLEAKLHGAIVARADATDAKGTFGVALALAGQVLEGLPALLDELGADERALLQSAPSADALSLEAQAQLQRALLALMLAASARRTVMLAVDDAHLIDERSAALLSLLAGSARDRALLLFATLPSDALDADLASLRIFTDAATVLKMRPLTPEQTESLLQSIFGEVAHLPALADRLYRVSAGAAGALMQLAQHLLERGVVRYQAGSWTLPAQLDPADLPASVHAALEAKLARLSEPALRLAQGMALVMREGLSLDELKMLLGTDDTGAALRAADELLEPNVARLDGVLYRLASESYRPLLQRMLSEADKRALHERLAAIFLARPGRGWTVQHHLLLAGREQEALERMLPGARDQSTLDPAAIAAVACQLPPGWQSDLRALIAYCERAGRPAAEAHLVRSVLVGFAALTAQVEKADVEILLRQLEHDCGYDIYASLPSEQPADQRLMTALTLAQQRFDAAPPERRVLPPEKALPMLARSVISAIGVMGPRYDYPFFRDLKSIEPYVSLSPALQVVQWNVEGTRALASGHYHVLIDRNRAILARMAEPDRAGLDVVSHRFMGLALRFSTTMVCTMFGRPVDEQYLAEMEADPIFTISAWRLRMLAALCAGDVERADACRREGELIRLRDNPPQMFEGSHVHREYLVYAFAGDMARLKQLIPDLERRADKTPGWAPALHHARGAYHELRGAVADALAEFEAGLALVRAGEHPSYTHLVGARLLALLKLGRAEQARALGEADLAAARAAELGPQLYPALEAMARVHSALGEHEAARALADEAIAVLEAFEAGGLVLGGAFETRARVALNAGDQASFERYARKCAVIYRAGRNPLLSARYSALMAAAAAARITVSDEVAGAVAITKGRTATEISVTRYPEPIERARAALRSLLEAAGTDSGFIYTVQPEGLRLTAQEGAAVAPPDLDERVADMLERLTQGDEDATAICAAPGSEGAETAEWRNAQGEVFTPLVLMHATQRGPEITGLVALRGGVDRIKVPAELLSAISQALHQCGDVVTLLAR